MHHFVQVKDLLMNGTFIAHSITITVHLFTYLQTNGKKAILKKFQSELNLSEFVDQPKDIFFTLR